MAFFDAAYAVSRRPVRLADADPDLFTGCSGPGRHDLLVETLSLDSGRWATELDPADPRLGLLVLDGLLVRTVEIGGHRRSELIGPTDLIRPWDLEHEVASLDSTVRWDVLQPARLVVLDAALITAACRWPPVVSELIARGVRRSHRLALQLAIADIRHIDERLLALLQHLGDRWGRMTTDGVHVPLRLTHDLIAQLIGAQRPTVTTGLSDLQRAGRLQRRADRTWVLPAGGAASAG